MINNVTISTSRVVTRTGFCQEKSIFITFFWGAGDGDWAFARSDVFTLLGINGLAGNEAKQSSSKSETIYLGPWASPGVWQMDI